MLEKMSDIIWAINPHNESLDKMIKRLRSYAKTRVTPLGVQLHFQVPKESELTSLDMQRLNNIYMICKEGINNAAKYSDCRNLYFSLTREDHECLVQIRDDGKGFNAQKAFDGNGLKNMQSRAAEMKARLKIDSECDKGTSIKLTVNIP
jgi:signal transduction histidine kinase